jgi:magnesium transporter
MVIEVLYTDKNIVRINQLNDLPADLSQICSVQIVGYSRTDVAAIERMFDIDASIINKGDDIEISSHFFENDRQLAFAFSFPYQTSQQRVEEVIVTFILKENIMFTFMAINFEQFIGENQKQKQFYNIRQLPFTYDTFLLTMLGIVSDYFADLTELISKNVKAFYQDIQERKTFYEKELNIVTRLKFNNLVVKESLNEYRRILHLLRRSNKVGKESKDAITLDLTDLNVINEYVQNNFERLDDLKEFVSSKIDLEQNRIFKTLTMITVCISLPTLIAGIYGMNFKIMPELEWKYGYVYGILLLVLSFIVPLIWFKRKKWL